MCFNQPQAKVPACARHGMVSGCPSKLRERLAQVRAHSLALVAGLEPEDLMLQGMADASPAKWHLGHTSWFFETFLLKPHCPGWQASPELWCTLFNSYYEAVGPRHPRPERGLLSRPPLRDLLAWRQRIDGELNHCLSEAPAPALQALVELGLQHEQQHQELLLMDLLDGFSRNPLLPVYDPKAPAPSAGPSPGPLEWHNFEGGLQTIGAAAAAGSFHFDNETPQHRVWLEPFALAERLVTNQEYESFIAAGGYQRPEPWMAEGWALVQARGWEAPRYWRPQGMEFSLRGLQPRDPAAPVRHLSWFEADAYARWAQARLPTEAEWEVAASSTGALAQLHGCLWQWTSSAYGPYPGFRAAAGAIGEYNGKFMSSQMVLRGSSFLTPAGHGRHTYRNFFGPHCRWQASGLRLARP
ncbi:MAG: hypothetical protein RLZZ158_1309 [Cyanobacteriota bacterium]|jgi:ergothioneine biosynthesis protein EgtB